MEIIAKFNSYEEMEDFARNVFSGRDPELVKVTGKLEKPVAEPVSGEAPAEPEQKSKLEAPAPEPAPTEELPEEEELPFGREVKDAPGISETDIKTMLAGKIKAGKKSEVSELFAAYGVKKLSELVAQHPDQLDEFYSKAEVI